MKKILTEDRMVNMGVFILLTIVAIVTIYPFYYILICSFNEGMDLMKGGVYLWPRKFTTKSYEIFLKDITWTHSFFISVARTVIGTALCVGCTSIFSYAISRKELMFRNQYRFLIIFTMYFSGGLIPFYVLLRNLQLLNTFGVYIIPGMVNTFFVITGINFFGAIPDSMLEAARIDGAKEIKVFTKIVLPVSMPFLATMALFVAVGHWNSWLDSAYFVRNADLHTLAYKIMTTIRQTLVLVSNPDAAGQASQARATTAFTIQSTAMVISMLPIMFIYPFLQKYFVQGMMIGAVKE